MTSSEQNVIIIHLTSPAMVAQARNEVLRAHKNDRILFILPDESDDFVNEPLLKILRKEADEGGVQVGFVTNDPDIRYFCKGTRLPVYKSEAAARTHWRWPKPEGPLPAPNKLRPIVVAPPPDAGIALRPPTLVTLPDSTTLLGEARVRPERVWLKGLSYTIFIGLIALAIAGLSAWLLPQATVDIVPARSQIISSVDLTARTGIDAPDYPHKVVPARVVQARVESFGTTPTTGQEDAPVKKATGNVTFINRTSREITIPKGTVVRTTFGTGIRFRTLKEATAPPGTGQQVTVPIEALEPGLKGNVPALTINAIEGPLNVRLRVSNRSGTRGGTVENVGTVTQADKNRLKNELLAQLQQQAYAKLGENLRSGEYIPPETVNTYVLAETYDRFAGEHADELGLQLQLLARGLAVDMNGARTLAKRSLHESAPPDKFLLEETIRAGQPRFTLFGDDFVTLSITASGEVMEPVSASAVRAVLTGAPMNRAKQLLEENFVLAQPPQITLAPRWASHLPSLPFRIIVRVYKQ